MPTWEADEGRTTAAVAGAVACGVALVGAVAGLSDAPPLAGNTTGRICAVCPRESQMASHPSISCSVKSIKRGERAKIKANSKVRSTGKVSLTYKLIILYVSRF